jgi:hypothetical protein
MTPLDADLNDWLQHKVRQMFEDRVPSVTEDVMFKWRFLRRAAKPAIHFLGQT